MDNIRSLYLSTDEKASLLHRLKVTHGSLQEADIRSLEGAGKLNVKLVNFASCRVRARVRFKSLE